jgi:hypothetical protein
MKTKGQGRTGREEERCLRSTLAVFLLAQNLGREEKKGGREEAELQQEDINVNSVCEH